MSLDVMEDLPLLRGEAFAGRVLQRVVVAAALFLVLGSVVCAALSLLALWEPAIGLFALVIVGGLSWQAADRIPARPLPLWSAAALVVIAIGSAVWTAATHSEQVLPRRDSASYLQSSIDLAEHHRRPIDVDVDAIGGPEVLRINGITLASPAFYQTGSADDPSIQPQFMIGPSAVYSAGWWLGGMRTVLVLPALVGALGVLAVGLIAAGTIGVRWGPLAALAVALCFPVLHTARSTYSEPLAMLTLSTGLLALAVAGRRSIEETAIRRAGLLAGLLVGGTVLVRADGLRETILLLPVAALALAQKRPYGGPLLVGAGVSTAVAGIVGPVISNQYLAAIGASLIPLGVMGVALGALCLGGLAAQRRGLRLPVVVQAWLGRGLAAAVVVAGLVLASRPLWQTVRQSASDPGSRVVAGLQQRQGLSIDGGRTYAEQTVAWLSWWVGPAALVIALGALAVLVHRAASRWAIEKPMPGWTGPLLVASGSTVLTLYRPGITPDHPWADRRLLIALPFVALLVVAAAAWLTRLATRRMPAAAMVLASAGTSLALLVPTALATWPHAGERVEQGEQAAVDAVCASLTSRDLVLMVDSRAANEWPQVLRGQCEVAALSTTSALRKDHSALVAAVSELKAAAAAHGRRLVLLSADSADPLTQLGAGNVRQVVNTTVLEDQRLLERRPNHLVTLPIQVWAGTAAR